VFKGKHKEEKDGKNCEHWDRKGENEEKLRIGKS